MASLQVRSLSKEFAGRDVLQDVSFSARAGDIVSVIGPSGCGKTTLIRCILGEIEPSEGVIRVDGEDITHMPVEARGVGIVYQSYALFPHMRVGENVAYGLRAAGRSKPEAMERAREMLELVELTEKIEEYPRELSGGQRQRVALARALAVQPRILLLDEAFAALDATTRSGIVAEVRTLVKRLKVTTLLVTHDQEEAFLFSKRILVLNEGRVVTMGTPEQVMTHAHPFIQGFVKMLMMSTSRVETDARGRSFITMDNGSTFPIHMAGVRPGDEVHVMVKKGPQTEHIEVWPFERDDEP